MRKLTLTLSALLLAVAPVVACDPPAVLLQQQVQTFAAPVLVQRAFVAAPVYGYAPAGVAVVNRRASVVVGSGFGYGGVGFGGVSVQTRRASINVGGVGTGGVVANQTFRRALLPGNRLASQTVIGR